MSPATVFFLSISMSVDAFAVSVGRGAVLKRHRLAEAMRTGAVFGVVESITPFLGWLAGIAANDWVAHFDHWLAFGLLMAVGMHMIHGAFAKEKEIRQTANGSLVMLIATALGTSLDAMAIGLSLAFIDVDLAGIIVISLAIGMATFIMATAGLLVGKAIGDRLGKPAEIAAGLVLCGLGTMILLDHLAG